EQACSIRAGLEPPPRDRNRHLRELRRLHAGLPASGAALGRRCRWQGDLRAVEVEGEYIVTKYNGITRVARGFANAVLERQLEAGTAPLNTVVDFELAGLASTKQGYWLDLRSRFVPDFLRQPAFRWQLYHTYLIPS